MIFSCCKNNGCVIEPRNLQDVNKSSLGTDTQIQLEDATWRNTIPFVPNITYGKIIKCYDGDTCTLAARPYPNEPVFRFSLRLDGIDAPEMRTKNTNEKEAAKLVQEKLSDLILNKFVNVKVIKSDKYGRLLCTVIYDGINVNGWLLEQNYAVRYHGGTKKSPEDWLEYINTSTKKRKRI